MADTILDALGFYLVTTTALMRYPKTAAAGKHPLWIEPEDGVPAPGEGATTVEKDPDIVFGAFKVTGIATGPYQGFMRTEHVELWIRSRKAYMAHEWEKTLEDAFHDKRNWIMGSKAIIESLIVRPMQRLSSDAATGFVFNMELQFQKYSD